MGLPSNLRHTGHSACRRSQQNMLPPARLTSGGDVCEHRSYHAVCIGADHNLPGAGTGERACEERLWRVPLRMQRRR